MKHIITILFILLAALSYGQHKYKKADRFFDKMWYMDAAKEYERAIKKGDRSMEVLQKAGDAYYFNTDMQAAYKWYDVLISEYLNQVDAEYIFRFVHSLEGIGQHGLAKKWMKEFSKRTDEKDARVEEYSQRTITIEEILKIQPQFRLRNLSVNTKFSDFGPMYYKGKLIYSSATDGSYYHKRTYNWNEQPFLDFQIGRINATETDVEFLNEFSEDINTKYHEATLAFSPDEKTVYFTRNNFDGKLERDQAGVNHLKLYKAELSDSIKGKMRWRNIVELPFNNTKYSVGHPAVSSDGAKLYFVSDMPGTIGATDIFVVDIFENDTYSQPRNLGPNINTSGREMFPYITGKKLYFASDGHLGLGGLDVFEAARDEEKFKNPSNLGAPLNSELDDFGFIINEETDLGFVCSNRIGGKGDDDIYSFERNLISETNMNESLCDPSISGFISNTVTGERIVNATVKLYDVKGKLLAETQTNINGNYEFDTDLDCNTRYDVKVNKVGYKPNEKPLITAKSGGDTIVPLGLKIVDERIVDVQGLVKVKIGIIYFDLNQSFIRNDAAIELNKVVFLMNQYPNMVINIESHTDSRSADDYNINLSDRRAKAAREYIISKGITGERILSAIGYGETQLVNNCKNGVICSESQHQLNRRSEFVIVKM